MIKSFPSNLPTAEHLLYKMLAYDGFGFWISQAVFQGDVQIHIYDNLY